MVDFNKRIDRKGTNCVKWDFMGVDNPEGYIPSSIADMEFAVAKEIRAAMKARIDRQIFGYTLSATEDYYSAVTGWFRRRFNWYFEGNQIAIAPGIVPALGVLVRAFTEVGEGVVIQTPVYYPFGMMVGNNDRVIVENPLAEDKGVYSIDFEDLERKLADENNTMMILCSPHNPMGRLWTEEELEQIIDLCVFYDVTLVSDEIHCDIIRINKQHIPAATLSNYSKLITCTSASKSFNLAGLQHSNIIFNDVKMIEEWNQEILGRTGLFGSSIFGHIATMTAYNECEYWLDEMNAYVEDNLKFIGVFLEKHLPKAVYHVSEATYFAWIDLRAYIDDHEALEDKMKNEAKLILDEGYIFGQAGQCFERLNVACPQAMLEECLMRIKKSLIA